MIIVHLIEKKILTQPQEYGIYKTIYNDLITKHPSISVQYFVKSQKPLEDIDNESYVVYKNYADLLEKVRALGTKEVFITTITESLVSSMHKLKKDMGQQATKQFNLYTNKAKEREIIGAIYPETVPNAIVINKELPLEAQIQALDFPVMLKPIAGVGSRGVMKSFSLEELQADIENLDKTFDVLADKGIHNDEYIVEEYVDGPQFVINYRVDSNGKHYLSVPTHVKTTQEIDIEGYGNWYRLITKDIYEQINKPLMHELIEKTIDAGKIRNTYISHNFRITSTNKYKTIEVNGRIGGYRLEMNREAANYNLFDVSIFPEQYREPRINRNVLVMSIWTHQEGKLVGFNKESTKIITALPSYKSIRYKNHLIKKKVAFATNGGQPLGTVVCVHDDQTQLEKDITIIQGIYKNVCEIE